MKFVTISPVAKPADFSKVRFTEEMYKHAVKIGDKSVPYPTALEAVQNSGGLYKIKSETAPSLRIKGLKDPDEMSRMELAMEMTAFGKPPRKQMNRQVAVEFIRKLRDEAASMIVEDEDGGEDAT